MRIKTRIQLGIILSLVLAATIGLLLFLGVRAVNEANRLDGIAAKTVKGVAELKIITHEYLLHPEERSLMQWRSKYGSLSKLLTGGHFKSPDEKIVADQIFKDLERFKTVFSAITTSLKKGEALGQQESSAFRELQDRMIGELLVKSQTAVSLAFQLHQNIEAKSVTTQKRVSLLTMLLLLTLTAAIVGISLWINRSVARPIAKLEKDTQIIGSGNLDHKVGTTAKDEIGQLSRAFDKMTADLKETTTSIAELNKEITDRKQVEEALKENEQRYKKAQLMGHVGNWEYELETDNFWASDEAKRIYGFDSESKNFTTEEVESCIPERERVHQALVDLIEKDMSYNLEFEIHPMSGPDKKIIKSIAEVIKDASGTPIKVVGVAQDITKQKEAEKAMVELEFQLRQSQKMELVGTLAGGIAHDYNNLLAAIMGNLSMAREETAPHSVIAELLHEAEEASLKARDLTQHFLTLSQGGHPVKGLGSIGNLLKEIPEQVQVHDGIEYAFSIQDDLWPVEYDPIQIKYTITNLLMNAVEAMPQGGCITIQAENQVIDNKDKKFPLVLNEGKYVRISIKDEGSGISEEHMDKIFDPYFSTKDKGTQKGMGMGLAIAQSVIQKHDGHIMIDSTTGAGTEVTIYLPAAEEKEEPETVKQEREDITPSTSSDQTTIKRVLVMDDEEMLRNLAQMMLERLGYEVETVKDGDEAIEAYKKQKDSVEPFDAVILDLTIKGGMGGKQTIRELIKIDPDVKAIVCSGYFDDPVITNFEEYGFKGAMPKPYQKADLEIVLKKVLR